MAGEPPPETPTPARRRIQTKNELGLLADLRRSADALGRDVEIIAGPTATPTPTLPAPASTPRPRDSANGFRLYCGWDDEEGAQRQ